MLYLIYICISLNAIRYLIQQKEELIEVTNKIITIFFHWKVAKMMSYEGEIFDYVLYSRALWNAVTNNEVILKL